MNKCLFPGFLAVLICLFLFSCKHEEKKSSRQAKEITIAFQTHHLTSDTVKLLIADMLNLHQNAIGETVLDASGNGKMVLSLEHPTFALLDYKAERKEDMKNNVLYLEPGDTLTVQLDGNEPNQRIHFEGKGAKANNYLAQTFLLEQPFIRSGGKSFGELDTEDFLSRVDSIQQIQNTFLQAYADSVQMPEDIRKVMEKRNKVAILYDKHQYVSLMQNNQAVEAMYKGEKIGKFELPEVFSHIYDEIPYDSSLLKIRLMEYANLLYVSVYASVYTPFYVGKTREDLDSMNEKMPLVMDSLLRANAGKIKFADYFLAQNIVARMSEQGLSPNVDSLYHKFQRLNGDSPYLASLTKQYNARLAVSPGGKAPDFYGSTPEGKRLALSDLKGKVVYIDVWATWCKPCREEFPASKKLQKQFADNDAVAMLYVSIDDNEEAWKKFLKNDQEMKGIQIRDTAPEEESIWKKYLLTGIPRYILIDQKGRIKDPEADRPSSGKVAGQINALLDDKNETMRN